MEIKRQQWGYRFGCTLLGAVFVYAAIFKLLSPQDFADSIAAYQIIPVSIVNLLALGLPPFEFVCGLSVITGVFPRLGILGIIIMLVVFMIALTSVLIRGISINCGCFDAHSWFDSNPWVALVRDAFLLTISILAYRFYIIDAQRSLDSV